MLNVLNCEQYFGLYFSLLVSVVLFTPFDLHVIPMKRYTYENSLFRSFFLDNVFFQIILFL